MPSRLRIVPLLLAGALALGLGASGAWGEPDAHAELHGFYVTGELDYVVADRVTEAEILFSRRAAAYVIRPGGSQDTFVLLQRPRSVARLTGALLRRENGDVDLPKDARLENVGSFEVREGKIVIEARGLRAVLRPRPALTGRKSPDAVRVHSPQYGLVERAFRPDKAAIQRLQVAKDVTVEVLFGSWCPRCQQSIGNALRVDKELAGRGAAIVFHGLPAPPAAWQDKRFRETQTKALPTAVVFAGERLVGRVPPADWKHLDVAIARLLR